MLLRLLDQLRRARRSAREQELARERDRLTERDRLDKKQRREEKEEAEDAALTALISDVLQRFEQQLHDDLADAIAATRLTFAQAEAEEQAALEALQAVQDNALILADGRRVYFDTDGRLFGEDHQPIGDPHVVAEAREALARQSDASSYEAYRLAKDLFRRSRDRRGELAEKLDRLDDLQEKLERGDLSPDELVEVREELEEIIEQLPQSAREILLDLQAARATEQQPLTDASSTTVLKQEFERTASQFNKALDRTDADADPEPERRQPAYVSVPPFE